MIGTLIGKGYTADVFDAGNGRALKLFRAGYPADSARNEFNNAQLIGRLNIPIIQSYGLIEYEGRHGILYERIDGQSMLELLLQSGDIATYAAALAALHKQIVACVLPGATPLLYILRANIEQTAALDAYAKAKLLELLDALPGGEFACHGDFHFGNVIIHNQHSYIIDYMNVCCGHPHGDVARTAYLIEMTPTPDDTPNLEHVRAMKKQVADTYLQHMGVSRDSLSAWMAVTAAARLSELGDGQAAERASVLAYLSARGFVHM